MSLSPAEKKRRQRERAKAGRRVIQVELMDREAWLEILRDEGLLRGVDTDSAVRVATEAFIWDLCRDNRREQAEAQLSQVHAPVTGLLDRETEPHIASRLIKAKDVMRPRPDDAGGMTYHEIHAEQETALDGMTGYDDNTLSEPDDAGFDDAEDFEGEDYKGLKSLPRTRP